MPTILITGSNRGIGLALARLYAGDGWDVIATCRDPARAEALRALADGGAAVETRALDVTDAASVAALASALGERPIDLLFNNAGVLGNRPGQSFGKIDYEVWRRELEVNLLAPVRMVETFVANVAASQQKKVAVISSALGSITEAGGGLYPYRTSKAAVNMAVRAMATDLAGRGITLMSFHPGWVRTDMGGPSAAVSAEEAAAGMARVLAAATPRDSGRFRRYDGAELPW